MNPRKHFDQKKLEELTESVRANGILQPLLVRQVTADVYEIVAGARRYRAAGAAGLTEVPAIERELTDAEVFRVQLTENMERDDLTPIEEADAYGLLRDQGQDVAAIAKTVNRKPSEVARRLALLTLPKQVRAAMHSGALPAPHAELIGRIPDAALQNAALERIVESQFYEGSEKPIASVIPFAAAKRLIEREFMTALVLAVFDPEDAALSPLGACSRCPHLAGNNRSLFGDVKEKNVCTNPKDFHLKTANYLKRLREEGYTVFLTPKEVARAFPTTGARQLAREFVDLASTCFEDPKRRTYDELLGKAEKLKTIFVLKENRVFRLYPAREIDRALAASGHSFAKPKPVKPTSESAAARSAAQLERIGEEAVRREVATKLRSVKFTPGGWIDLVLRIVLIVEGWRVENVIGRHGVDVKPEQLAKNREKLVADRLSAMTDGEKRAFLVDLLIGDWNSSRDKAEVELYRHVLKLAGVNYAQVANAAIDAAKQAGVGAKKSRPAPVAAKSARS